VITITTFFFLHVKRPYCIISTLPLSHPLPISKVILHNVLSAHTTTEGNSTLVSAGVQSFTIFCRRQLHNNHSRRLPVQDSLTCLWRTSSLTAVDGARQLQPRGCRCSCCRMHSEETRIANTDMPRVSCLDNWEAGHRYARVALARARDGRHNSAKTCSCISRGSWAGMHFCYKPTQ